MQTIYHGTATTYLPYIQQEGLKVVEENRWNARIGRNGNYNPSKREQGCDYVCFTLRKDHAVDYALLRAKYLRAKAGDTIKVPSLAQMIKVADNPFDALAEPVLLKVNLPDDWRCDRDPNDFLALTSMPIPSRYIDAIIALNRVY